MKREDIKQILPSALVLLGIGAVIFVCYELGFFSMFSSLDEMQSFFRSHGHYAIPLYFLLQFVQVIVSPIPGNITTLAGGLLFGFWTSFLVSTAAVIAGSAVAFLIARKFGRPIVYKLIGEKLTEKYLDKFSSHYRMALFMMFLLPFFPDDALAFIAGLTPVSFKTYMLIVVIARPWGLLFSSFVGSGNIHVPIWGWIIIGVASVAIMILSIKYSDRIENFLTEKIIAPLQKRHGSTERGDE